MQRARQVAFATPAIFMMIAGCHHAAPAPAVAPSPVTQSSTTPSGPSAEPARENRGDEGRAAREAAARVAAARAALLETVYFDYNVSDIRADQQSIVGGKVPVLTANPDVRIRIAGNADERGSAEYNIALGMRRASTVKRYLGDRGVDTSRVDIISYGEERPVCTTHDEDCWRQNRRDEFDIVSGDVHTAPQH